MMKLLLRVKCTLCTLLMMNIFFIFKNFSVLSIPVIFLITVLFVINEFFPSFEKKFNTRLNVLAGGYELIITSLWALILEITGIILAVDYLLPANSNFYETSAFKTILIGCFIAYLVLLLHYLNGFWRTVFCSSQLGIGLRILMFFFWWVVPVNLFLFIKWCKIIRRELYYEREKYALDSARAENHICATKYPILMVHGIFFRDWQFFNYWGRIPVALKKNGATVFYGGQQSSRSIQDSAEEIKKEILRILDNTGAEKVNVIAHSKGGLDTRYVISHLGMEDKIASLTTINTPHRGCRFVDALLNFFPDCVVAFVAGRYNSIFRKLGDTSPDFLAGVRDLTASSCAKFNEDTKNSPNVYYQSCMSKMSSVFSAAFPLNIGYLLVKKYEGENDGLVSVSSSMWGNYRGLLTAGKKGISHGDMIDLTRKNIKGFDVSEFYVQLIAGLKDMGY